MIKRDEIHEATALGVSAYGMLVDLARTDDETPIACLDGHLGERTRTRRNNR